MPAGLPAALRPVRVAPTAGLVAEQLRGAVVDGGFAPGQQLAEAAIADRLGVSRGPVREAMARLVQEGLLVAVRNRGVFVVDLDAAGVEDVYAARRVLERHAAEMLRRSKGGRRLRQLEDLVERMTGEAAAGQAGRVAATDLAFHECLVDGAGSARLSRMFATLAAETRICLGRLSLDEDLAAAVAEHRLLLEVLRTGTRREVLATLDEHLDSAVRHLTERSGTISARPEPDNRRQRRPSMTVPPAEPPPGPAPQPGPDPTPLPVPDPTPLPVPDPTPPPVPDPTPPHPSPTPGPPPEPSPPTPGPDIPR